MIFVDKLIFKGNNGERETKEILIQKRSLFYW